jgi:hypothetical protein
LRAGLPDKNQKSQFGALEMKRLVSSMEYLTAIWHILWPFCNFLAIWYIFPRFGVLYQEKSGNPGCEPERVRFNDSELSEFQNVASEVVACCRCDRKGFLLLKRITKLKIIHTE